MKVKIKLSKGAKAELTKVAEWLEAGAPHVDLDGVEIGGFNMSKGIEFNKRRSCGTVCCIAGALVQFSDNPMRKDTDMDEPSEEVGWDDVMQSAAGVLGKNMYDEGVSELFMDAWVTKRELYDYDSVTPAIAARCIRHAIDCGVVDWERAMKEDA